MFSNTHFFHSTSHICQVYISFITFYFKHICQAYISFITFYFKIMYFYLPQHSKFHLKISCFTSNFRSLYLLITIFSYPYFWILDLLKYLTFYYFMLISRFSTKHRENLLEVIFLCQTFMLIFVFHFTFVSGVF